MRNVLYAIAALSLTLAAAVCSAQGVDPASPVVILVSIDGFRPDYLDAENTPNLYRLGQAGVQADYLESVFPSSTFPSHYSIATGLYPENHGIVGNTMYDPVLDRRFSIGDREAVRDSVWWQGEPIWVTLEKQGRTTAPYFWVGSEAAINGVRPTRWMPFDSSRPFDTRINDVLEALSQTPRPALVTLYFGLVDSEGHRFGPDAEEVKAAAALVDRKLGSLIEQLQQIGLYESVNLVVLGDHGMASYSNDRVVALTDFVPSAREAFHIVQLSAAPMLNLKNHEDADSLLAALRQMDHVFWYRRGQLPAHLHYNNHVRIPDLVGVVEDGWRVAVNPGSAQNYVGGGHGYDPAYPSMRSIFVAHGPGFKKSYKMEGFSLVHIYELLCAVLEVEPAENNGNLDIVNRMLATDEPSGGGSC